MNWISSVLSSKDIINSSSANDIEMQCQGHHQWRCKMTLLDQCFKRYIEQKLLWTAKLDKICGQNSKFQWSDLSGTFKRNFSFSFILLDWIKRPDIKMICCHSTHVCLLVSLELWMHWKSEPPKMYTLSMCMSSYFIYIRVGFAVRLSIWLQIW